MPVGELFSRLPACILAAKKLYECVKRGANVGCLDEICKDFGGILKIGAKVRYLSMLLSYF